jgi:hypothetical protein
MRWYSSSCSRPLGATRNPRPRTRGYRRSPPRSAG